MYKVLVVDDDEDILELMVSLLEEKYEVYTAENGKDALEKYFKLKPDIIITDLLMPVMDGIELIKNIQSIGNNTIICVSSGASATKIQEASDLNVKAILTKPLDPSVLLDRIEESLKS